jgi:hypothetical protein
MKLYQLTLVPGSGSILGYDDGRRYLLGKIYPAEALSKFRDEDLKHWFDCVGELPSVEMPATLHEVVTFCDEWISFLQRPLAAHLGSLANITKPLLTDLRDSVWEMPNRPTLPSELRKLSVKYSDLYHVAEILRMFREWSKDLDGKQTDQTEGKATKAVEALLGDESRQVLDIVRSEQSADDKMRKICGIDRRFLAFNSPQMAELLGTTDAAIRKTRFWKHDRKRAIEADQAMRVE